MIKNNQKININMHHNIESKNVLGFWIYLMSDCILFACLFAAYIVLIHNTYGGSSMKDIFEAHYVFIETMVLLTSSLTYGLLMLSMYKNNKNHMFFFLILSMFLGLVFVIMEVNEFHHLVSHGQTWQSSGFLSGFFTLVGVHGLHVSIGIIWMFIMLIRILKSGKITESDSRKLTYLGLFWGFLDIVWIFIFTLVYLTGSIIS